MKCKREPFMDTSECNPSCEYLLAMEQKPYKVIKDNKRSFIILTSFLCTLIFSIIITPLIVKFFVNIPQNTGDVCMNIAAIDSYGNKLNINDILTHVSEFYSTIIIVLTTLLALIQVVCYVFIKNSSSKEIESQISDCLTGDFFKHTLNHYVREAVNKQFQDEARKAIITSWVESTVKKDIEEKLIDLEKRLIAVEQKTPSSDNKPEDDDEELLNETKNRMSTQEK